MKQTLITNNKQEIISDFKLFPSSFSAKEIQNSNTNNFYNVNTINRKNTFKISEKECSDINSLVRTSVEKINDLLNSQEFNMNKKNQTTKSQKSKEKPMKTNFTFNINNFINVPNNNNKNESMNTVNKKQRYDDLDDDFWITSNNKDNNTNISNNENNKVKSSQKRNDNEKTKNRNINFGTNIHNPHNSNEKIFRNSVKKRKLFEEGINNNENNNINIVNFAKNQKNKKKQKLSKENEKDKSITVNTKYKKFNSGEDYLSQNRISFNNSLKNKNADMNNNIDKNKTLFKYSVSDDISNNNINNNKNNQKKKFSPNIISINSLSDHQNITNFIFNNTKANNNKFNNNHHTNIIKENINMNVNINNNKPKIKKQSNKKYYKSPNNISINKNYKITKNNNNNFNEDYKPLLFTEEKNNINLNKNKSNNNIFTKSHTNKNSEKNILKGINFNKNLLNNDLNDFSRQTMNKIIKKENTCAGMDTKKKCGYSCDQRNNKNFTNHLNNQNAHKILNKIYYKEFPNKIRTNTIFKLILFMNEYLISNNLLDDYYDINNQKKLDSLSKFISSHFNSDFPQQDDVNFDRMISSIKKIQRFWRKKKMEKFMQKNNKKEENELKKMVLNKYIKKSGFKIKKIIGLFNSMVECFDLIEKEKEIEEMFYNIQQVIKRKLTPYEKNLLYKEYINNIISEN